ncbi:MAG: hypothetical protein NVSMB57_15940 [Actinomycetota bacterium]
MNAGETALVSRLRCVALTALLLVAAAPAHASAKIPNDPGFVQQWGLRKMHVVEAWALSRGSGVVVAVVDTGVDALHPDLKGHVLKGYDFVDNDGDASDGKGHGTHVAGTIAAVSDNGIGVAGVAPDARILPVRVLGSNGEGDPGDVARGIRWSASHGAKVINLSPAQDDVDGTISAGDSLLHDTRVDRAINDVARLGVVVVVAAGNSDSGGKPRTSYHASTPGVIVVGATTKKDKRAAYSNYGDGLDVVAPGGGNDVDPKACTSSDWIVSTWWNPSLKKADYGGGCGTSMAVAHVSGVAALLVARGLSNAAVVRRIIATAVPLSASPRDLQTGHGRVDALRALGAATVSERGTTGRVASPTRSAISSSLPDVRATHRPEADSNVLASPVGGALPSGQSKAAPVGVAILLLLSMSAVHARRAIRMYPARLRR